MSRHLFTSDLHLGHAHVADLRGFPDVETHDAAVRASIADAVASRDILWILGDVVGPGGEWLDALDWLYCLPCRVRLVLGNHDPAHPMHRRAYSDSGVDLWHAVQWVGTAAQVKIVGRRVMLSHFPYVRDHTDPPRHMQWRLRDEGAWLIHGHTHSTERVSAATREVHVGWDAWRRPLSDSEIAALIAEAEAGR